MIGRSSQSHALLSCRPILELQCLRRTPGWRRRLDDAEALANLRKSCQGAVQVLACVGGGDLGAEAGFAFGDDRIPQAFDVDALAEQLAAHVLSKGGFTQHDGDDGMPALNDLES